MIIYPLEALSRRFDIKDVPSGSLTEKGIVRLVNEISDDETSAISINSVRKIHEVVDSVKDNSPKSTINIKGKSGTTFTISTSKETIYDSIDNTGMKTIKISGLGDCTVVGAYGDQNKTISLYIDKIGIYDVGIYFSVSFSADDYDTISALSKDGSASSYYAVGDVKEVTLNGSVGNSLTFSNTKTYMQILAFDHNKDVEMNGEFHMVCGFGKSALTGGKDIAFVDGTYGNKAAVNNFNMNSTSSNSGGWKSSTMRTVICSAFKNTLPSALQTILRSRTIYTDNKGGSSDTASNVTTTTDTVYIPAEFEVFGTRSYANSAEQTYQQQLAYYANGNSKIRYTHSDTSTAARWWLRSANYYASLSSCFCRVDIDGAIGYHTAYYAWAFVPLITI